MTSREKYAGNKTPSGITGQFAAGSAFSTDQHQTHGYHYGKRHPFIQGILAGTRQPAET